jgi:hypothetical protein
MIGPGAEIVPGEREVGASGGGIVVDSVTFIITLSGSLFTSPSFTMQVIV